MKIDENNSTCIIFPIPIEYPIQLKTLNFHDTITEHFTAEVIPLQKNLYNNNGYLKSSAGNIHAGIYIMLPDSTMNVQLFFHQKEIIKKSICASS